VVSDYVSLTRKGDKQWGLCPFHSEKTPSFSVSIDRQTYYCFGCHKGGGVLSFVMEAENLSFPDAVRFLAKRAGMQVPETGESGAYRQRREKLLALNRRRRDFSTNSSPRRKGRPQPLIWKGAAFLRAPSEDSAGLRPRGRRGADRGDGGKGV
jgi:DNA primase catalytic core